MPKTPLDLTGRVFGKWTVLGKVPSATRNSKWQVCCTCGDESVVQGVHLVGGQSAGCLPCHNREIAGSGGGRNRKDLTGQVFGKWTVLERSHLSASRQIQWLCECACGIRKTVDGCTLRNGRSTQCKSCAGGVRKGRP